MSEITKYLDSLESEAHAHVGRATPDELLPLVYDELRRLATACMRAEPPGMTLQATALVHEAWLRVASREKQTWNDRTHFFRSAAQAMRRILVDRARRRTTLKHGHLRLSEAIDVAELPPDDRILLIDEALARFAIEDPDNARLVALKFFGGFTNREIAQSLGLAERTIERRWHFSRTCLYALIQDLR